MISLAIKLLDVIGDISEVFIEEADNMYFSREKIKKTLTYGAIGLAASFGVAAAVWVYRSKRNRKKNVA